MSSLHDNTWNNHETLNLHSLNTHGFYEMQPGMLHYRNVNKPKKMGTKPSKRVPSPTKPNLNAWHQANKAKPHVVH